MSEIDLDTVANDFRDKWNGILPAEKLEHAIDLLTSDSTAYPADGEIVSLIFYLKFRVDIKEDGGKSFNGNAGGASTPGGGALFGNVYTDDLDALYANTVSFEFQATSVYLSILFFDSDSHLLGHFECGALSTVNGVGGGSGSWS